MTVWEERLAGADQALAELGKSDEEVSSVRKRFLSTEPLDLQAVDAELSALTEGVAIDIEAAKLLSAQTRVPEAFDGNWENENTEVEIVDESDFVLLVDERDLEELEKVGEEDAMKTSPPALPQAGEEDEGFFKKLFGTRRSSNRP